MFYESNNGNGRVPRTGFDLVKLVKAGIPDKAQKSDKAMRNWLAKDYAKKLTPAAPAPQRCFDERRLNATIATPNAVIESGRVRRGEVEPQWVPPEQPRPVPITAAEIIASAKKRDTPTSGTRMDSVAQAIILAGQKARGNENLVPVRGAGRYRPPLISTGPPDATSKPCRIHKTTGDYLRRGPVLLPGSSRQNERSNDDHCSAARGPRRPRSPGSSFHTNIRIEIGIMAKQTEDSNRIAELEAGLAQAETELASLRPAPAPALKPYVEEGTRIILEPPPYIQPPDFPSQSELDSLLRIVLASYPKLDPAGDADKFKTDFRLSFLSLCHIRRKPEVDKQHTMSFWRDYGQDTLAGLNITAKLGLGSFIAATIAHGDVVYTHPFHEFNFSMSAGLFFGGGTEGRPYAGAWKKHLNRGVSMLRSRSLFPVR